jgi:hypothetical protein
MAVVQISRIQLRRGKESETGIPQLASGELAWAIDTQKLYIGNGAVSEGAPTVGNTRIITDADNLLDIATSYTYKINDPNILTSADVNYPITRTLQERLDERVTAASYGIYPGLEDQTVNIQRAIDNLYLNNSTMFNPETRVTLEFAAGTYYISDTIFLPSHVRLVGAGIKKTIFQFTSVSKIVFRFIEDQSTTTNRRAITYPVGINPGTPAFNDQPKFILLKNFTLDVGDNTNQALQLNAVRDSVFEDLEIKGTFDDSTLSGTDNSIAIGLYALSSIVTCQRNEFNRINIEGFKQAVFSKTDIKNNVFNNCNISECGVGFSFGDTTGGSPLVGEQYGPRFNHILDCSFEDIDEHGIYIETGYGNRSRGNTFINVGNDRGGNSNNQTSNIAFIAQGNSSLQENFDRQYALTGNQVDTYLPEVSGIALYSNSQPRSIILETNFIETFAFRLPISQTMGYEINYVTKCTSPVETRRGKITVAVNYSSGGVQLSDDFDYTGSGDVYNIIFSATKSGNDVIIKYINVNVSNQTTFIYTYQALS